MLSAQKHIHAPQEITNSTKSTVVIIDAINPALAIPLVFPFFLAITARIIPTGGAKKASTKDAIANP